MVSEEFENEIYDSWGRDDYGDEGVCEVCGCRENSLEFCQQCCINTFAPGSEQCDFCSYFDSCLSDECNSSK
jgi:hypothetical protein